MFKTHLVFSLFLGLILVNFLNIQNNKLLFIVVILLFSVFPDIDYRRSTVGRRFGIISWIINLLFRHRGVFHSIYFPLLFFLIFYYLNLKLIAFAALIGYLSHLFLDMMTYAGIKLFHPLHKFQIKGFLRSGGFLEFILFLAFLMADVYLIVI